MTFGDANDALVVNTSGRYLLQAKIQWAIAPAGWRQFGIAVNGLFVAVDNQNNDAPSGLSNVTQDVSVTLPLNAGDAITILASQGSGQVATSLTFSEGAPLAPLLQANRIGPL
ncbi:hypothetical protein ABZY57_04095 [Streptomyces sp. NPDC006450]|uniref:hypothetical protein n=1 Tax=Streptomyces sp. NPDC006450 TaxID=3155458 RepID=UPI0033A2A0CB